MKIKYRHCSDPDVEKVYDTDKGQDGFFMINGRQGIKVGQYLSINGKQLLLAKIENGNVVLTGCNKTWVYGLESFKRTIRQVGYELVEEE